MKITKKNFQTVRSIALNKWGLLVSSRDVNRRYAVAIILMSQIFLSPVEFHYLRTQKMATHAHAPLSVDEQEINAEISDSNLSKWVEGIKIIFPWPSNWRRIILLGAFAKLRKATIKFVTSVRLSAWNKWAPTPGFSSNLIFEYFSKSSPENSSFIKIGQE